MVRQGHNIYVGITSAREDMGLDKPLQCHRHAQKSKKGTYYIQPTSTCDDPVLESGDRGMICVRRGREKVKNNSERSVPLPSLHPCSSQHPQKHRGTQRRIRIAQLHDCKGLQYRTRVQTFRIHLLKTEGVLGTLSGKSEPSG